MRNFGRRFLALFLAVVLLFGNVPMDVFATTDEHDHTVVEETVETVPEVQEETEIEVEAETPVDSDVAPSETTEPHEHSYVAGDPVAATAEAKGYTLYTCECGDSYQADFVEYVAPEEKFVREIPDSWTDEMAEIQTMIDEDIIDYYLVYYGFEMFDESKFAALFDENPPAALVQEWEPIKAQIEDIVVNKMSANERENAVNSVKEVKYLLEVYELTDDQLEELYRANPVYMEFAELAYEHGTVPVTLDLTDTLIGVTFTDRSGTLGTFGGSASGTTITATAEAQSQIFGANSGDGTITITNNRSYPIVLEFAYAITGDGSGTASGAISGGVGTSGDYSATVAAGGYIEIKFGSGATTKDDTVVVTLTNIVAKGVITFGTATNGSYTVNGATPPASSTDACGTQYTLVATPADGYVFTGWFINDSTTAVSTEASYTFTNAGSCTITPKFAEPSLTIEFAAAEGDGSYTVNGEAPATKTEAIGTTYTLVATPATEQDAFVGWYKDAETTALSTDTTYSFTTGQEITANCKIYPKFRDLAVYNITAECDTTLGSVAGSGQCIEGSSITLTATANGSTFLGWTDTSGKILSTAASYSFTPTADTTVKAVFASAATAAWFKVDDTYLLNDLNAAAAAGTKIVLAADGTLPAGDYNIPSGDTLLIPYDTAHSLHTTVPNTQVNTTNYSGIGDKTDIPQTTPYAFRTLKMAEGAHITVDGAISVNATMYAGGTGAVMGGVNGPYGHIEMDTGSTITVNSSAYLYCWGYITGSGSVVVQTNGTVYENFQTTDWRGGSCTSDIASDSSSYNRVFPMNQYYVQNIEVPMTLYAGAQEKGYSCTTITAVGIQGAEVPFVGENSLFTIDGGYLIKDYDEAKDRQVYEIHGDVSMKKIRISMKLTAFGGDVTLDSSEYVLPITCNLSVDVVSGKIDITEDLAFLPGSEITVRDGANCNLSNGKSVYVYDLDEWGGYVGPGNSTFIPLPYAPGRAAGVTRTSLSDAKIQIDGTVNADAGFLYTTTGGAVVISTGTGKVNMKLGTQTETYQLTQSGTDASSVAIPIQVAKLQNADGTTTNPENEVNPDYGTSYTYTDGKWVPKCNLNGEEIGCSSDTADEDVTCKNPQICKYCDAVLKSVDHTPGAAATCTTAQVCTVCSTELKAALGHTETTVSGKAATCTETGLTEGKKCSVCGEITVAQTTINALGHSASAAAQENKVDPTCTADGSYDEVVYCSVCGNEMSREVKTIEATGHKYTETIVDATCTTVGSKTSKCTACGDTVSEEIPAKGHTAGDAATCTEEQVCTVCDEVLTKALGHNQVTVEGTPSTCTATGLTDGVKCDRCDLWLEEQQEIPMAAHVNGEAQEENRKEATCTADGSYDSVIRCTVCGGVVSSVTNPIPTTGHTAAAAVVENEVAATCTADGSYDTVTYCSTCNAELSRVTTTVAAKGHTEGGEVVENEVAATCTEPGSYDTVVYCTVCGEVVERVTTTTPATGHTEEILQAVAPTCTETGLTAGTKCSVCDEILVEQKVVDKNDHTNGDPATENNVAATCTADGSYDTVVYCVVCKVEVSRETTVVNATGHSYDTVVTAPTCTVDGYTTYTCSKCGDSYIADTVAAGHKYEAVVTAPTCTAGGYTTYTCSVCGDTKTGDETAAIGHSYDAVVTAPTCTAAGYTTYTCSKCNDTYTADAVGATGHSYETVVTAPTCTAGGYTTYTCSVCGDIKIGDETEATGHSYEEKVTTAATCTGEGVKTFTCTAGDHSYTEKIAALGHTPETLAAVAPTCTEDGLTEGEKCSVCGYVIKAQTEVDALGHDEAEAVKENNVDPTCTATGSYESVVYCSTCNAELSRNTVTVDMIPHTEAAAVKENEVAPTCTAAGSYDNVVKCSACGEELSRETVTVDALGHTPGEAATCTTAQTCDVCGETVVVALGHNYVGVETTAATCTEPGVMTYTCERCPDSYPEEIAALDHRWFYEPAKDATCTEEGQAATALCGRCGLEEEGAVIPALGHLWNAGTVTEEATCSAEGKILYTCTRNNCGETEVKPIDKLAHTTVLDAAVAATCTETGLTAGSHCSVCNEVLVAQTVIDALGHTEETVAGYAATCTEDGLTDGVKCSVCDETLTAQEVITAKGHTEEIVKGYAATCTKDGLTDGVKCSVCGEILTAQETIPAPGHSWGEGDVKVEPTCTGDGYEVYTCTVCTATKQEELPKLGHSHEAVVTVPTCTTDGYTTYTCPVCGDMYTGDPVTALGHTEVVDAAVAPTCTETGLEEGKHCDLCNEVLVAQTVVPALGHTNADAVIENNVAPTCTAAGSYDSVVYCSVCNAEISRTNVPVTALGHTEAAAVTENEVAATCTAEGSYDTVVYCDVCGEELSRETTTVDKLEHDYKPVVTAPTCNDVGYTTYTCSVCGDSYTGNKVPKLGHTPVEDAAKAPTCTETGLTLGQHCSTCGEVLLAQDEVPALGHTEVIDKAKAPTCTATGLKEGKHCSVCNEVLVAQEEIPATGHTPVVDEAKAPTCTDTGLEAGEHCSVCNEVLVAQAVIDALGHTEVIDAAVAATCTEPGLKEGKHCSVCNKVLVAQVAVPATGHTTVIDAAVAPTCTETGLSAGAHCSVCNEVLTAQIVIAAKDHTKVVDKAKAPTCTETGLTEGEHCSVCNETLKAQETVDALGHTEVIDAAVAETCTTAGKTEGKHCSVCNEVLVAQEVIPATGHTKVVDEAKAPTCTESGLTAGEHCSVCNYVLVTQRPVAATGHTEVVDIAVTATCTTDGLTEGKHCSVCDEVLIAQEVIDAKGHTEVIDEATAPTCLATGLTEGKHCSVCDEILVAQEVLAKLEHVWDDGRVTTLPDCVNEGVRTFTCSSCNGTKVAAEPALGHEVVKHEGKKPTYTSAGWEPYETCAKCDEYNTMVPIPALGEPEIDNFADFIENLELLENIADTYVKKVSPGKDPAMLIIKYIRTGVDRYNSGSWNIMAGYEDADFASYVRKYEDAYNAELADGEEMMKVTGMKNLTEFSLPNGDWADIGHVFGSMDITYTNKTSEDHADVSGWAGDTVDLMSMTDQFGWTSTTVEGMVDEINKNYFLKNRDEFEVEPEEGTFSNTDIEGDLDAFYIMQTLYGTEYESGTLTNIFSSYMTKSLNNKQRAAYFLNYRLDGVSLRSDVRDAVYNEYLANGVVTTLEGTRPFKAADITDLRKACCYVFADYLCKLAGDFVEIQDNAYYSVFQTETSILAPGIVQKINYANTPDGKTMVFYLATGDINSDNVRVYANYNNNDPAAGWAMQRVIDQANAAQAKYGDPESEQYIENYNVIASINGAGYDMYTGEPSGILVMDGKTYHPIDGHGFFGILDDGTAMIGTMEQFNALQAERPGCVKEAIATFGDLIKDGKVVAAADGDRASRTAVGITATGKVVFMVLDGRQGDLSCGGNMREIAQIMLEAGCVIAVNLDGGGSSTYVAREPGATELSVVSKPSDGISRSVSTSLMMVSTAPSSTKFDHAVVESAYNYFAPGASGKFVATAVSATGNVVDMPEGAIWAVSDEKIGSVDADGIFTAKAKGTVYVQLKLDGVVVGSKKINVVDPDNVYFEKSALNAIYGEPKVLPVKAVYEGKAVAITEVDVTLRTANEAAGVIDGFTFTGNEESGLKKVVITAELNNDPTITASLTLTMFTKDEASFDFDNVTGGDRQLSWVREVSNAQESGQDVYRADDLEVPMVTSYTFAMDMSQIEMPKQLEELTYMLPGADVEGNNTAWSFLLQLAERVSTLTEVTPILYFDKNMDVDYSKLSISAEYFYLKDTEFNEEENSLKLIMKWHRQDKPIDPDTANPLCVVTGISLTPKEDAAWNNNDALTVRNTGTIAYDIYLRANALYSFSSKPENQEIFGLYPFQNVREDGVQENGGHFESVYKDFEDQYTLINGIKDGWIIEGGGFAYYVNGQKYTGIQKIDGYYYDFGENGINIGQKKYTGEMTLANGEEYYLVDGVVYTGWMIKDMKDVRYYNPETGIRETLKEDEVPSTCIIDGHCIYTTESGEVKRIDYDDAGGHEYVKQADGSNVCSVCGHVRVEMEETTVTLSYYLATYSGTAKTPGTTVVAKDGRVLTKPGQTQYYDYYSEYINNIHVGTASVKLTASKYGKYSNLNTWRGNAAGSTTVTFEIRPDVPAEVTVESKEGKAVLSWTAAAAPGVTYVIHATDDGRNWTEIAQTQELTYAMNIVDAEGKFFRISTTKTVDGKAYDSLINSAAVCLATKVPVVTVSTSDAGKPILFWTDVEGAVEYKIYRTNATNGKYANVFNTTGNSYTHASAVVGETYYYYVTAVLKDGTEISSEIVSVTCGAEAATQNVIRLAGSNRHETALEVANQLKKVLDVEKFDAVIIAAGYEFADALAGSYLSTVKNAPILLSYGNGGKYAYLDDNNIEYIKANLKPGGTVYILGGEKAVPTLYDNALSDYKVTRLGGANRFETNLLILKEAGIQPGQEILVCTGTDFADSLSASATGLPILLVFNQKGELYGGQPDFLKSLGGKNSFCIIGGENAVGTKLEKALGQYGKVARLAGENRLETSVMVAKKFFPNATSAVTAYGWNYPDGLCGGALAYAMKAPLLLTYSAPQYYVVAQKYTTGQGIKSGVVLGGEALITKEAVRAIYGIK